MTAAVAALLAASPVVLAPMEDVTDGAFRRVCRSLGAGLCVTEFVGAEQIVADSALARRRAGLAADDRPTAIQIYGADPDVLLAAARVAERAGPAFLDLNCGCWVPAIARRGAGAGWLRDPDAMVAAPGQVTDRWPRPRSSTGSRGRRRHRSRARTVTRRVTRRMASPGTGRRRRAVHTS